jgi:signal transduction histidine kinase
MLIQDSVLTLGFIAASDSTQTPLLFVSLIPISTAAMRYSRFASVSLVILVALSYFGIAWYQTDLSLTMPLQDLFTAAFPYFTNSVVLLLAGGAVAQISTRMKQTLTTERVRREKAAAAALEAAHQKSRLIFELASTLSATLNHSRVLEAALDVSNAGLKEFFKPEPDQEITQVGMILLFRMDQSLYIEKSRGISHQDERKRFPGQQGILAQAIDKADPVLTDDPGSDPELSQIIAMHYCQQVIVVPLRAGFESFGLLVLGSSEPDTYSSDYQDLLVAICNQAVMALQNASLYQNLMEEKERLIDVEEDERTKLARNLHDGPTQTIAAIAMRLNYIRMLIKRDPEKSLEELAQLEDLARKTTKEIRQMLFTLRPLILETQGLIPALEQLKQKVMEIHPTPIHSELDKEAGELLSPDAQGAIFYIVVEALNNARKYANGDNVWIRLFRRGMNVITEIEDDGAGFDVGATEENYATRGSLGMKNLYERAILVNGRTTIKSAKGKGTKIIVTIPVEVNAQSQNAE